MRKTKVYLPKTMDELKRMNHDAQSSIWMRYSPHTYKRQIRALWYYIACENMNLKIETRHMQKIRKYIKNPDDCMIRAYKNKYNLTPGTELVRTFRNIEHKVLVADNGDFLYGGKTYKTLSAVAKEICGIKVSGPDFFGFDNKLTKGIINAKN